MQSAIAIIRQAIMQLNPLITNEEWAYFESGFIFLQLKPKAFLSKKGRKIITLDL